MKSASDAAQHHVDAFEGAQRPHPQRAVTDHEIGTLDEWKAEHSPARYAWSKAVSEWIPGLSTTTTGFLGGLGSRVEQRQAQRLGPGVRPAAGRSARRGQAPHGR